MPQTVTLCVFACVCVSLHEKRFMWHPYAPRGFDRKTEREQVWGPPTPRAEGKSAAVSPTTATALIKAVMIGLQPRWNLSSHIITRRQLALAELQPSGLQRTHSDHSSYSTSASCMVGLVLLNPVTTTKSFCHQQRKLFVFFFPGCKSVVCRLA